MQALTHHDITLFLLGIALLLGSARIFGELAQRWRQPAVLGEIFAGILLGPTIFGALLPDVQTTLFPQEGPLPVSLQALTTLSITLFLMVAGLEVDLSTAWRQGKVAIVVGLGGIALPFLTGFVPAWYAPDLLGAKPGTDPLVFAMFLATAMSITALPVIARILLDLNLFRSDLGITIISAAILNDLAGWIIFAFVLSMMSGAGDVGQIAQLIVLTLAFTGLMLTAGRWLVNRWLPWIQANSGWPGGVLGFALTCALLSAAFTEWIGIHAVFGAFLFGVAIGDSHHLRQRTRATIEQFVSFFFAPLFFASIGLKVNFLQNFDFALVAAILVLATAGKVIGCGVAARWMGYPPKEARAIGYGMNARGAMEIILGMLALNAGIIGQRLFVALVVMALVTSMMSGVLIQRQFGRRKSIHFIDFVSPKAFVPKLMVETRREAVENLAAIAAESAGLDLEAVVRAVSVRDEIVPSGLGNGVAVPHLRIAGLKQPSIAVGVSPGGIDFDASDGHPARIVVVMLTPQDDPGIQLDLLASIARIFRDETTAKKLAARVKNFTELRAFLNVEASPQQ